MHGLQVNRDFIEKQHGRMDLLQPIIPIVRYQSPSVKGGRLRLFSYFMYSFKKLRPQTKPFRRLCEELGIGWTIPDGGSQASQSRSVAISSLGEGLADGMANSPLHTGGRGQVLLRHAGVEVPADGAAQARLLQQQVGR